MNDFASPKDRTSPERSAELPSAYAVSELPLSEGELALDATGLQRELADLRRRFIMTASERFPSLAPAAVEAEVDSLLDAARGDASGMIVASEWSDGAHLVSRYYSLSRRLQALHDPSA